MSKNEVTTVDGQAYHLAAGDNAEQPDGCCGCAGEFKFQLCRQLKFVCKAFPGKVWKEGAE